MRRWLHLWRGHWLSEEPALTIVGWNKRSPVYAEMGGGWRDIKCSCGKAWTWKARKR